MNNDQIRALKDRTFRQQNDLAHAHPAGISTLDDSLLGQVGGGTHYPTAINNGCTTHYGGTGPGTPCLYCEF